MEKSDISPLQNLINLEVLYIDNNKNLKDISPIKNLINLEKLAIDNLNLTDEIQAVNILKNLPNLITLICRDTFKKIDIYIYRT